jgi:hypothetical protein
VASQSGRNVLVTVRKSSPPLCACVLPVQCGNAGPAVGSQYLYFVPVSKDFCTGKQREKQRSLPPSPAATAGQIIVCRKGSLK